VSERELGLYAVAATLSTAAVLLTHDVGPAIFPRVASGEYHLAARALRVTLPVVVGVGVALGALTIPILTIFFGRAFLHAAPMTWILLGSMVPLAGTALLGRALVACGAPGPVLRSELLGLGVTALGLVLLLPSLGGIGAAIVSIAAYSVNFAFLLRAAQARLGGRVADYLVPRREDLRWASATVQELLATRLGVKLGRSRDR
jgi:O-antigen/teichoic acid export membrane protein